MRTITVCSFAKLNLTFEILDTLPGGYHRVRTIFQSVDLADRLEFSLSEGHGDEPFSVVLSTVATPEQAGSFSTDAEFLQHSDFPLDDGNLIVKAARTFEAMTSCGTGTTLRVIVEKKIPIAAGMAGGSGNAAAALKAMQYFFPEHCSSNDADLIASQLGSDINYCLHGGTQLGTNRGEILHPLSNSTELTFLIVKPRAIAISTPWIFRKYDDRIAASPVVAPFLDRAAACREALASGTVSSIASSFYNAFEEVCFGEYPDVKSLRDSMLEAGCLSANITGSGPTLFGLVSGFENGLSVQERLVENCRGTRSSLEFDSWVTQSTTVGLLTLD